MPRATPALPDPIASLTTLRRIAPLLFYGNPCRPVAARLLWADPHLTTTGADSVTTTRETLERRFGVVVLPLTAADFEDGARFAEASAAPVAYSDSYMCFGSSSFGSGRSVFVEEHQIKGVGRTVHCAFHDFQKDMDGRLHPLALANEILRQQALSRLLAIPPIRNELAMVTRDDPSGSRRPRLLLGRRGSPLRITHVTQFAAEAYRIPWRRRRASWAFLLQSACGVDRPSLSWRDAFGLFELIVGRALQLTADTRVWGLKIANWPDNGDLHARTFDCEDARIDFPLVERSDGDCKAERSASPRRWLDEQEYLTARQRCHFTGSLQSLANAFLAIEAFCDGLGIDLDELDRHLTWARVERLYFRALNRSLAGLLFGRAPPLLPAARLRALYPYFPLVPRARLAPLRMDRLVEGFASGVRDAARPKGDGLRREGGALGADLSARLGSLRAGEVAAAALRRCEDARGERLHGLFFEAGKALTEAFERGDWEAIGPAIDRGIAALPAPLAGHSGAQEVL